jgi:phage host-nuclease inhibitor protein Gam
MTKSRIKLTKPAIETREQMEALIGEICTLTIESNQAKLSMDSEISAVREKYEAQIGDLGERLKDKSALAQTWAEANPEAFGKLKSLELTHGKIGFRTGKHQLKPLAGWTFDRVKEKLRNLGRLTFLRVKEEVDKEGIIARRLQGEITDVEMRDMGLRLHQDESFFIEPKLQELASNVKVAA